MAETILTEIVTPLRVMLARDVGMVVVPGEEGLMGVLPRHMPLISALRRGVVEVHEGGKVTSRFMVDGGIAEISETSCTVLAERAETLDSDNRKDMESRLKAAIANDDEAEADFIKAALVAI